jgi:hypothetical protein
MKKLVTLSIAIALFALPLAGSAACPCGKPHKAKCAPACVKPCEVKCITPCTVVRGVVNGVGCVVNTIGCGISSLFCMPCN